ncbi:MAG: PIN domain-containing protein [Nanoarchaeota archaeon]|nr:PIN domain-containing protein [Nanoarchaeota archaeon]
MVKRKNSEKYDINVLVPDTSVIIGGVVSDYIKKKILKAGKIIINEAVLSELEYQANSGRIVGEQGLKEVKKLRKICKVKFVGRKPLPHEIKNAKRGGEIDSLIRQTAFEEKGTLITADRVQGMVAEAKGIKCIFIECSKKVNGFEIVKLMGKTICKVCLREGEKGVFVKGSPGKYVVERKRKVWTKNEIEEIFEQALEEISKINEGFMEVNKKGFSVVKYKDYRFMRTCKPVSNKVELIAIKKPKSKKIYDYKLNVKYIKEIADAECVFVVGDDSGEKVLCESLLNYFGETLNVCSFVNDFEILLDDKIMQYKRHVDNLDVMKDSGKDYVYVGDLTGEDDGLLIKWLSDNNMKTVSFLKVGKLVDCVEKIINLVGLRGMEKAIIIKVENNKIKNLYKTNQKEIVDLFKDKFVLRIEND